MHDQTRIPMWIVVAAFASALVALAGGYWDDAWHTERGRDDFFIAPHIAIYAGIATAGAALTLAALLIARRHGLAGVRRHRPLLLGLLAVAVTMASGPIDNLWHAAFGRDAVIWSPPHMLGIAGTLALGAALLGEVAARRDRWLCPATAVAGALVLASAAFTTVEYDTDVPQFDEVFYLPALGFAAAIALVLVRSAAEVRWAATASAAVYTVFIAGVSAFLAIAGFRAPALPLLIAPAVIVDLWAHRAWSAGLAATAFTVALHVVYVPVRNIIGEGVFLEPSHVLAGFVLTWLGCFVVFAVAAGGLTRRRLAPPAGAALLTGLVLLGAASVAVAHDPGQGEDAGTVAMTIRLDEDRANVRIGLPPSTCERTQPRALVARRAGETLRASLGRVGCRLTGSIRLPARGRWFVYAEMMRDGRSIESWLPVTVGSAPRVVKDAARYAYIPPERGDHPLKIVGGALLYVAVVGLLVGCLTLVRPRALEDERSRPVPSS